MYTTPDADPATLDKLLTRADWAREHARTLLEPLGSRWLHTQAVADTAWMFIPDFNDEDALTLIAAAYLHDIGYAPSVATTGFHSLDGARHLHRLGHPRLAGLVAHHTGAIYEAQLRGLATDLNAFVDEASMLTAALTYCDLTNGPNGQEMTPEERIDDVTHRYGRRSLVPQALDEAWPYLVQCFSVGEALLEGDRARAELLMPAVTTWPHNGWGEDPDDPEIG